MTEGPYYVHSYAHVERQHFGVVGLQVRDDASTGVLPGCLGRDYQITVVGCESAGHQEEHQGDEGEYHPDGLNMRLHFIISRKIFFTGEAAA